MRLIKVFPHLFLICFCLSGCTILCNLDEISTLGDYSREKDAQHRLVKTIDDQYDALANVIAEGKVSDYNDEASWVRAFGEPILKRDLSGGGQRWLYRHAIYRLSKDKVYVYFDRDGKMTKWEKLPCSKFF